MELDISKVTTYQAGAVQAAVHRMLQKLCDDILQPFGLTKMQWLIIGSIFDSGQAGVRLSDLSQTLGTTMPYLTNSINLLESRGILQRKDNTADTRSKLIVVSDNFKPHCHEIEAKLRDGLRTSIYSQIDPREFHIYLKVMYQLMTVGQAAGY